MSSHVSYDYNIGIRVTFKEEIFAVSFCSNMQQAYL